MPVRYRRVAQAETGEDESKKIRAERADRISAKLHALVWVLAAIGVIYFTDFFNLVHSDKLNRLVFLDATLSILVDRFNITCTSKPRLFLRFALNLAIICFFTNVGIFLYLTVWLPLVLKITAPWDVYCPNMIPMSTGLGVAFSLLFIIAFWPVWGILTPLYVAILLIGLIFSAHFVPWPC